MKQFTSSQWQDVEIRIEGEPARIQFRLDGNLVTDFQHTEETTKGNPAEGTIAVQVHPGGEWVEGNKARFRNIRIKGTTSLSHPAGLCSVGSLRLVCRRAA